VRELERKIVRRRLDKEMQPYRRAGMEKIPTDELLRAVRQVLRIPVEEIAAKLGVNRSVLFGLEESERRKTITLRSLSRVAKAMGCKVVYGVVPESGLTLEELAEERMLMVERAKRVGRSASQQVSESASQRVSGLARAAREFAS
jgi:transcriptional regulator with XRE-family HTH domain